MSLTTRDYTAILIKLILILIGFFAFLIKCTFLTYLRIHVSTIAKKKKQDLEIRKIIIPVEDQLASPNAC